MSPLRSLLAVTIALVPGVAAADHPVRAISADGAAPMRGFVATESAPGGIVFARQVLPPRGAAAETVALSRVLYLNHAGVTLSPGDNSSITQTSSIVTDRVTIAPWTTDLWPDVMSCMQEVWSRFDVTVTDVDPGTTPHIEGVFGGSPSDVGLPNNVAGVSPFTSDCEIIDNSIVFTFTDNLPADARQICEVMAQEIAHSYGLDHEMLASDPMTYLDYTGNREFKDVAVPCGEFADRTCGINGSACRETQDSVQLLTDRVGLASAAATNGIGGTGSDGGEITGGCSADRSGGDGAALALGVGLAVAGLVRRRR